MDIQAIIDQVVGALREAPEKVHEIVADPAGAIEQITGHRLEEGDLASVAQGVLAKIGEEGGDLQEKLAGYKDGLKAGTYTLNTSMTPDEMIQIMAASSEEDQDGEGS